MIGLPEHSPDALLADKGYDADAIRADLAKCKIEAVIRGRSNRRVKSEHDRELYKPRNCIERMFGHLRINRAIATRYDQLANSFLGMVHLATARYWLKFVHAASSACRKSANGFPVRKRDHQRLGAVERFGEKRDGSRLSASIRVPARCGISTRGGGRPSR